MVVADAVVVGTKGKMGYVVVEGSILRHLGEVVEAVV